MIVVITSDASGESRAARKRIVAEFPWFVAPDCFAHQKNLVVGDYYKVPSTSQFLQYTKKATNLIAWLRSKTMVLAMLRDVQKALNLANPSQTQWVLAHYLAFRHLLDLRTMLEILVKQERDCDTGDAKIVTGDAASRQKAKQMLELIKEPLMWHTLAKMITHIGPLAMAIKFAQAAHCQLDKVLIILGYLMSRYLNLSTGATSTDDEIGIHVIIDSLEKHWSKSDQTVFITAVILNPLYKAKPFAQIQQFTIAGITSSLLKLWQQFYSSPPPESLRQEILDYLQDCGNYEGFSEWAVGEQNAAEAQNKDISTSPTDKIVSEIMPDTSEFDSIVNENSLNSIAEALSHQLALDNVEDPTDTFTSQFEQITLQQLFNFLDDTWTNLTERIGMRSLDDELEFYELVELDAEGEEDEQSFNDMMCSTV
ncbi:hypothetical protein DFH29DRAFT_1002138 [Suillus ampliporus]|nr:hypothetical protein DFH29DRAFT_1002138 [Suillus ampliporus]